MVCYVTNYQNMCHKDHWIIYHAFDKLQSQYMAGGPESYFQTETAQISSTICGPLRMPLKVDQYEQLDNHSS